MLKNKRVIAMITCIAIVFTLFFSMLFIALESNHDCTGERCPICHEIQICQETLKTIGTALLILVSVCMMASFSVVCNKLLMAHGNLSTLVSLKVKLTD